MDILRDIPQTGSLLGLILVALILYRRPIIESLRSMGRDPLAEELVKLRTELAAIEAHLGGISEALRSMRDEMLRRGGRG